MCARRKFSGSHTFALLSLRLLAYRVGTKQSNMCACRTFSGSHTFSLFRFARKNREPAALTGVSHFSALKTAPQRENIQKISKNEKLKFKRSWDSNNLDCFTKEVRNDRSQEVRNDRIIRLRTFFNLSLRGTKQSKMSACRTFSDSQTFGLFRFARKNRDPATLSVLEIPPI
jgi:hypothetical protein